MDRTTIKEFAALFEVPTTVARGVLEFFKTYGMAHKINVKTEGKKGKPEKQYIFDEPTSNLLTKLLTRKPVSPFLIEAPAEPSTVENNF